MTDPLPGGYNSQQLARCFTHGRHRACRPRERAVSDPQDRALLAAKVPVILYFGDYIGNGPATSCLPASDAVSATARLRSRKQYNADGGDAAVIGLSKTGLYGNSHFLFQESNSRGIASHIQAWLAARGL